MVSTDSSPAPPSGGSPQGFVEFSVVVPADLLTEQSPADLHDPERLPNIECSMAVQDQVDFAVCRWQPRTYARSNLDLVELADQSWELHRPLEGNPYRCR